MLGYYTLYVYLAISCLYSFDLQYRFGVWIQWVSINKKLSIKILDKGEEDDKLLFGLVKFSWEAYVRDIDIGVITLIGGIK